jgi:hypothetical protein
VKETTDFENREVESVESTQLRNEMLVKNVLSSDKDGANE